MGPESDIPGPGRNAHDYFGKAPTAAHQRADAEGKLIGDDVFTVTELLPIACFYQLQANHRCY